MTTRFRSRLEQNFHRVYRLPYETVKLAYTQVHHYTPDFIVSPNAVIELKGLWVSSDRTKHLAIKAQHPLVHVLLVFQDSHKKLSKASKTSYSDWCNRHDLAWCSSTDHTTISTFIKRHTP